MEPLRVVTGRATPDREFTESALITGHLRGMSANGFVATVVGDGVTGLDYAQTGPFEGLDALGL